MTRSDMTTMTLLKSGGKEKKEREVVEVASDKSN